MNETISWNKKSFDELFNKALALAKQHTPKPEKKKITLEEYRAKPAKKPRRKGKRGGRRVQLKKLKAELIQQLNNPKITPNFGKAKNILEFYKGVCGGRRSLPQSQSYSQDMK